MSRLFYSARHRLARAVLRKLGVGKTEGQEEAVASIISALDDLGVLDTEKALDLAFHGPATVHVQTGGPA